MKKMHKLKKHYRFNSDLLLTNTGKLIEKKYDKEKRKWEQWSGMEHQKSFWEYSCYKSITFEKGTKLNTFLKLISPYARLFSPFTEGWIIPVLKEYKRDLLKNNYTPSDIKYVELYKNIDFDLFQLNKLDNKKQESYLKIHCGFHGIGKSEESSKLTPHSLSFQKLSEIAHLPIRLATHYVNNLKLRHYLPYEKMRFKKTKNGYFQLIPSKDNNRKKYLDCYDLDLILSREITKRHKSPFPFPRINTTFCLWEIVHAIFYEVSFHGIGKERDNTMNELKQRVDEVRDH